MKFYVNRRKITVGYGNLRIADQSHIEVAHGYKCGDLDVAKLELKNRIRANDTMIYFKRNLWHMDDLHKLAYRNTY